MPEKLQILLTNDDGIQSPGLGAAAEALSELGFVHVVAPRLQSSGTGRSLPNSSDGKISTQILRVHAKDWTVYAVGGTPAQAVLHGVLEVIGTKPALVVSGINYGENLGTAVTASGTIGAALEAATMGVPALAISLQVPTNYQLSYSRQIDFSTSAYFTTYFGRLLLANHRNVDVSPAVLGMREIAFSLKNANGGKDGVVGQGGTFLNRIKHLLDRTRALLPQDLHYS